MDKETFLRHLFATYDTLEGKTDEDSGKPAYFRFLTLLCFRIFLQQRVDVAVLEVGLGGRLDATNCIRSPVVCGVTPLGFDHMNVLGNTLPEISREKAGIFKKGCPAYTVPQREDAMGVLHEVAKAQDTPLEIVPSLQKYTFEDSRNGAEIEIGLSGDHQKENAALAIRLVAAWEAAGFKDGKLGPEAKSRSDNILNELIIPKKYVLGLEKARWPGRAELFEDTESDNMTFFIDGAHTAESLTACAEWFSSASDLYLKKHGQTSADRVIIFNCMEERDPASLLLPFQRMLLERGAWPGQVVFSPTLSSYTKLSSSNTSIDLSWQYSLQSSWENSARLALITSGANAVNPPRMNRSLVQVSPSLPETLQLLRKKSKSLPQKRLHVLVTGSLYLVGDFLRLLGKTI